MKSLKTRKVKIGDVIDASNSALLDDEDKIEKAKEMIKRANLLLSKAESVRLEEIARLEQLKAQNDEVLQHELAQGQVWLKLRLIYPRQRTLMRPS